MKSLEYTRFMRLSVRNIGGTLYCTRIVGRPQCEAKVDMEIHGYNLIILAPGRQTKKQKQEDWQFKASLGHIARPCLQKYILIYMNK